MRVLIDPSEKELELALMRPTLETENLELLIEEIFEKVKIDGDIALTEYAKRFDNATLESLELSTHEWNEAEDLVPDKLKSAIRTAAENIERFHKSQVSREQKVETTEGVFCWRRSVAIQSVGLYIPGGTAPLFSTVLMLGIPAKIADCKNTILCTPPNANGKINPAILYAAKVAGIKRVFKIGGAQAIAAMSLGTESVPIVDKVFGPGNQYVTAAKMYAQRFGIAIDMPAGPSEVLVAADDSIPVPVVAADLLAQAEHGVDSQVVFITDNSFFVEEVQKELDRQLENLPRAKIAKQAVENSIVIVSKPLEWAGIINYYAPEHLIIMGKYEDEIVENIVNAGSIFIGQYTAESFGDYASGTNHTLPTNGFARSYSGVSLDSFVKKITYQHVTKKGLVNLGETVITMAEAEGLRGHANAVTFRYKSFVPHDPREMTDEAMINRNVVGSSSCNGVEGVLRTTDRFIRKDLLNIESYSSARDEFGTQKRLVPFTFLDANENGLLTKYNRYPDPLQHELKSAISKVKNVSAENLVLGNGSDEVLDLIFRLTTTPFIDSAAYLNPSYGMYRVLAEINGLSTQKINLDKDFRISVEALLQEADGARLLIICNPNNPTGMAISKEELIEIVQRFNGIVVIDEAYIDFCVEHSMADQVENYSNLIVVQTLSKAYGLAALRVGMAIANTDWVKALNAIKPPYNLSSLVQKTAIEILNSTDWKDVKETIVSERNKMYELLTSCKSVEKVVLSKANFIIFKVKNSSDVYRKLLDQGVVVRHRDGQYNCANMLRVSIGNSEDNNRFIDIMKVL